jgi:hypothetical protein
MLVQHLDGLDAMHDLMRLYPPKQRQFVRLIGGEQRLLRL